MLASQKIKYSLERENSFGFNLMNNFGTYLSWLTLLKWSLVKHKNRICTSSLRSHLSLMPWRWSHLWRALGLSSWIKKTNIHLCTLKFEKMRKLGFNSSRVEKDIECWLLEQARPPQLDKRCNIIFLPAFTHHLALCHMRLIVLIQIEEKLHKVRYVDCQSERTI